MYRYAPLASHIIGYLGRIPAEDGRAPTGQGLPARTTLGKSGIEPQYEDDLRGTPGSHLRDRRPRPGRPGGRAGRSPCPGNDVQLTIDLRCSSTPSRSSTPSLRRPPAPAAPLKPAPQPDRRPAVRGAGRLARGEDPRTASAGHGLQPAVRQPLVRRGLSKKKFQQLFGEGNNQTAAINRAISGQYQIGSTMKLFTSVAGCCTAGSPNDQRSSRTPPGDVHDPQLLRRRAERLCKRRNSPAASGTIAQPPRRSPSRRTCTSTTMAPSCGHRPRPTSSRTSCGRSGSARQRHRPARREPGVRARRRAQEEVRRPQRDLQARGCAATTSATTSTSPSARACCRSPRCSWPTPTPRSPTAACLTQPDHGARHP